MPRHRNPGRMPHDVVSLTPIKIEHRSLVEPWRLLEREGFIRLGYLEFRLLTQTQWILRGKEQSPLSRIFTNMRGLIDLLGSRGKILIFGTEPFRSMTFLLKRLKTRHHCIFNGSWPWDEEAFDYRLFPRWRKRLWLDFFRGTVCVCATRGPHEKLLTYGARSRLIPWPVDTEVFRPAQNGAGRNGRFRVLFVGEFWELKGIHVMDAMLRGHRWDNETFVFAGRGRLQPVLERLKADGYPVELAGFVSDRSALAELMRGCDALMLPSVKVGDREEKFGVVLLEAMASGLPLIGSDCAGPRQVIEPGRTGLIVPQKDPQALRRAVLQLSADPDLRARMGACARRKAEETYDMKVVARQWAAAMEAALQPGPAGPEAKP